MSASLVGSEMCIRDRRHAGHLQALSFHPANGGKRRTRLRSPSDNPVAVSYTHLTLPTICSV
eukprot:6911041-Alexandrium_andersonii.AAC.1